MWVSGQSQSLTETTVLWLSLAQKLEKCRSLSLCCYPVATFFCQSSANCCSSSWNWFILLKQLVAIRARGFAGEQTRFPNKIALQLVFWLPTLSAEESVIRVFHLFRISLSAKCSQQRCSLCFLLHQHSKTHTQKERHLIKKKNGREAQFWWCIKTYTNSFWVRRVLGSSCSSVQMWAEGWLWLVTCCSSCLFLSVMRTKILGQKLACWDWKAERKIVQNRPVLLESQVSVCTLQMFVSTSFCQRPASEETIADPIA